MENYVMFSNRPTIRANSTNFPFFPRPGPRRHGQGGAAAEGPAGGGGVAREDRGGDEGFAGALGHVPRAHAHHDGHRTQVDVSPII